MWRHAGILLLLNLITPLVADTSFTLVLDMTKSMGEEINQIKAHIRSVVSSGNITYENYILVPFRDTVIEPAFITKNRNDYVAYINAITPSGGLDCPENSLSGIETALMLSEKESKIFVFTDAYANDYNHFLTVRDLCNDRRSQVIIFLSGYCLPSETRNVGNMDVYYDVAKACSGTFLSFDPVELRQAFELMKAIAGVQWTDIMVTDKYSQYKQFTHTIDPFTTDFIIVISGDYVLVDVYNSNEIQIVKKLLETRHSLVIRVLQPSAGHYTVSIRANGVISATFYTKNDIKFQYGFSTTRPNSLWETSGRPIAGWTNYILIKMDSSIQLNSIEWFSYNDNEKNILYLEEIEPGWYLCNTFIYPGKTFKFWVIGRDKITLQEIKVSTKLISSQEPVSNATWSQPRVELQHLDSNLFDYESNVTLVCKVTGYPKPNIYWEDEGGVPLVSQDVLLEIPHVHLSYMNLTRLSKNSTIYCKCNNALGSNERSVDLFVNRTNTFEVIQYPESKTITYDEELSLFCEVNAYPEATISWYINGSDASYASSTKIKINKEEFSLTVSNFGLDDVGLYECRITNEVTERRFEAHVEIAGLETPKVRFDESEVIIKPGDFKEIECRTSGVPTPTAIWKYKPLKADEFGDLPEGVVDYNGNLKIDAVVKSHSGVYRCTATNAIGEDSADVELKIQYAPIINENAQESLIVREGREVMLLCEVDSVPEASVQWRYTKNDGEVSLDDRHTTDEKHTHHFTALHNDSGYYQCIAENNVGKAEKSVYVNVLVPPYIEPPHSELIEVPKGSSVDLPCNVLYGNPTPTTVWKFTWTNSGSRFFQRGGSTNPLQITKMSRNEEGMYLCIAENEIDIDRIKYRLKML